MIDSSLWPEEQVLSPPMILIDLILRKKYTSKSDELRVNLASRDSQSGQWNRNASFFRRLNIWWLRYYIQWHCLSRSYFIWKHRLQIIAAKKEGKDALTNTYVPDLCTKRGNSASLLLRYNHSFLVLLSSLRGFFYINIIFQKILLGKFIHHPHLIIILINYSTIIILSRRSWTAYK